MMTKLGWTVPLIFVSHACPIPLNPQVLSIFYKAHTINVHFILSRWLHMMLNVHNVLTRHSTSRGFMAVTQWRQLIADHVTLTEADAVIKLLFQSRELIRCVHNMSQTFKYCKNLMVTGANRGLGLQIVKSLLTGSFPPGKIIATARNPEGAMVTLQPVRPL